MPGASLNVPHFKQEFQHSCIPACARMVLAFFYSHHTEAELRVLMRTDPNGTPVRRLTELTHLGFDVDFVTTDVAGLAAYLTSGLPPSPCSALPRCPTGRNPATTSPRSSGSMTHGSTSTTRISTPRPNRRRTRTSCWPGRPTPARPRSCGLVPDRAAVLGAGDSRCLSQDKASIRGKSPITYKRDR